MDQADPWVRQFKALLPITLAPPDETKFELAQERTVIDWLSQFTDHPRLPATTWHSLWRSVRFRTVGEVNAASDEELLNATVNFGPKSLALWRSAFPRR